MGGGVCVFDVCWIVYQNGKDFYIIHSNNNRLKHYVYDKGKLQEWAFDYMYSNDKNRDKVIIKEINKLIKAIKEHLAYLEYLKIAIMMIKRDKIFLLIILILVVVVLFIGDYNAQTREK